MKKVQNTRGYERYMALDIHREYILVGAWNEEKDWVLSPRRISTEKFPAWAKKNIGAGDILVLETTTNVWATYDTVAPLAGRVLVANAAEVEEIAKARVKTDKEDVKKLLKLLIGGIVPEVWVPPMEVREMRAFISYRGRLVKTSAMIRNRLQSLLHKHNLKLSETGLLDQVWWEGQKEVSSLEKMQIRQELRLLQEVEKVKTAVDEELQRQSVGPVWGKAALQLMQLPGVGYIVAMTVLSAIGDISRFGRPGALRTRASLWHRPARTHTPPRRPKKAMLIRPAPSH